ncbi:hypothetical protein SDJN02_07147, partial [Cucurbita argyrosperma subsp. argyrosperma]
MAIALEFITSKTTRYDNRELRLHQSIETRTDQAESSGSYHFDKPNRPFNPNTSGLTELTFPSSSSSSSFAELGFSIEQQIQS